MWILARTPKPSGSPKSARPSRETDLTRVREVRDSADRLMVVCGAETTEFDYLTGFKAHFKRRTLSVKVCRKPGSPCQVVEYAVGKWGGAGQEFDQVWCVVDVDEFEDLDRAVQCAADNDIELVVSNPCFEIWLLLHHVDHRGWVADYRAVKALLRRHVEVPADKKVDFARQYGGELWKNAAGRARLLAPEGAEHLNNPSTRMWRLVMAINGDNEGDRRR